MLGIAQTMNPPRTLHTLLSLISHRVSLVSVLVKMTVFKEVQLYSVKFTLTAETLYCLKYDDVHMILVHDEAHEKN